MLPAQLFTWRRQAREGRLGGDEGVSFAQAVVACKGEPPVRAAASEPAVLQDRIEIVLADGLRVIVAPAVDADALARILCAIERR